MNNKDQQIQLWQRATKILDQLYDLNPQESLDQVESMQLEPELEAKVRQLLQAREQHNTLLNAPESVFLDHFRHADLSGHVLGDFRLIELLARGGMSAVYRARKITADAQKDVAIKVMPQQILGTQSRQLFAQELTTLSKLHHPHIVNLHHGSISDTEMPYFQMELIEDASTISDYVRDNNVSQKAVIRLFVVLCQTLEYAHLNGIIHRDIKPNNVLVDAFGQIIVIDFGIASIMQQPNECVAYTRTYAAPEQILKNQTTAATDVYSVCLLLLECLQNEVDIEQLRSHNQSITDTIARLPLPSDLKALLNIGLREEPQQRYTSMAALRQDLELFLDKRPLKSIPYSPLSRLWKNIQRQPLVSALSLLLFLSFGVGFTVSLMQMQRAQTEQAKAVEVKEFLISSIQQTDPDIAAGHDTTVKEMLVNANLLAAQEHIENPELAAEINQVIGSALLRIGEYHDSIEPLEKANNLAPNQAYILIPLATAYLQLSENSKAQNVIEQLQRLPLNSTDAVEQQLLQAQMFTLQGEFKQAEGAYKTAIQAASKIDTPELMTKAQTQLSSHYSANDQNTNAIELLRIALSNAKQQYGPENTHTLTLMSQLAIALQNSDSDGLQESADLFTQLIPLQRKILGDQHPQVAKSLMIKAAVDKTFGDIERAEKGANEALAIAKQSIGDDHLLTGRIYINLGQIKLASGDLATAIEYITTGLKNYEHHLGPEHYETLQHKTSLTALMLRNNQFEQASKLAKDIYHVQKTQLGEQHRATLYAQIVLTKALIGLQRYDEANAMAQDCYDKSKAQDDSNNILNVGCGLALEEILYIQGEYQRALELANHYIEHPIVKASPDKVETLQEHIDVMLQP